MARKGVPRGRVAPSVLTTKAPTGPPKPMPKSAAPSLATVLTENGVPAKKAGQIAKGVKTGTIKP